MERTRDLKSVERRVANGDLAAALVIPKGFSDALGQGTVKLEVLVDPGAEVSAGIWESIVRSVAVRYSTVVVVVRTTMEAAAASELACARAIREARARSSPTRSPRAPVTTCSMR